MATELEPDVAKLATNAKRAAVLAVVAVVVALVVLAIDNGIKRAILDEAGKVRKMVDEFKELAQVENGILAGVAEEVRSHAAQTGPEQDGGDPSPGDSDPVPGDNGVADAPGVSAAPARGARVGPSTAGRRPPRSSTGP